MENFAMELWHFVVLASFVAAGVWMWRKRNKD